MIRDPILEIHARLVAHNAGYDAAAEAGLEAEEAFADAREAIEAEGRAAQPTTSAGAIRALEWAAAEYRSGLGGEPPATDLVVAMPAGAERYLRSTAPRTGSRSAAIARSHNAAVAARAQARGRAAKASARRWRRRLAQLGRVIGLVAAPPRPERLDLLFGLSTIAAFMRLSKGQVRGLIARRAIPAFELDGVACARQSSLVRQLEALERAAGERR